MFSRSQFSRFVIAGVICLASAASLPTGVAAQEAKEVVKYQLTDWKNIHTKNNQEADKLVKTFKMLQVENQVSDHGNHKDVKYRCPKWKQLSVKDHDMAHQWETWLKKLGFQTKHEH